MTVAQPFTAAVKSSGSIVPAISADDFSAGLKGLRDSCGQPGGVRS